MLVGRRELTLITGSSVSLADDVIFGPDVDNSISGLAQGGLPDTDIWSHSLD